MPAYRRRERVVFIEDVNIDTFGRTLNGFPVGPKNEHKWAFKGDTGVVSSWSKGGWLKVRLDRHGAVITVRSGPCITRENCVVKPLWSNEARTEASRVLLQMRGIQPKMAALDLHVRSAISEKKTADVEVIEAMRIELESAARMLLKLSFTLSTQISAFPTKSFGALQSRGSTPSPVNVPETVERVDVRQQMDVIFG